MLILGDCLEKLKELPDNSVDAIVTDPPYFLLSGSGSGGFMNKEWDGIIDLWKYLWVNPQFVENASNLLKSLQVERSAAEEFTAQENASMEGQESNSLGNAPCAPKSSPFSQALKKDSVALLAVTKRDLLDSLSGSLRSLITSLELSLSGVSDDASFVIPISLRPNEPSSTAARSVLKLLQASECQEKEITFTQQEVIKIKDATVAMAGGLYASRYTKETGGLVGFAENTVPEERYSATISFPIVTEELTKSLTLLLYATLVMRESSKIPQGLIINFFKTIFQEASRVLKPGGHLLAFGGTRTYHQLVQGVEDAGYEIRDMCLWIHGQGFPKSANVQKQLEKMGHPDADQYEGIGTALKPACEPIVLARKPLSEKTVAENVLKWGTGGLNIDGGRVEGESWGTRPKYLLTSKGVKGGAFGNPDAPKQERLEGIAECTQGRFPAHLIHDGSEEVLAGFPNTVSKWGKQGESKGGALFGWEKENAKDTEKYIGDSGSAARFFYCAKPSKAERDRGCEGMEEKSRPTMSGGNGIGNTGPHDVEKSKNHHPTVKAQALMQYLIKLITPPHGVVLDPFMGSGSTGVAAKTLGFDFVGIEKEEEYFKIAKARIDSVVYPKIQAVCGKCTLPFIKDLFNGCRCKTL